MFNGPDDAPWAYAVFNDGSGPALYATGEMDAVGSVPANFIAKWNGTAWSALGGGLTDDPARTRGWALGVFNDGTGPALYVGGQFGKAGGVSASNIAKWNGTSWSPLGTGSNGPVYAISAFNDGAGAALYVGGNFSIAGGGTASKIAKWNGSTWSSVGGGLNGAVYALTVFDDGTGSALYAAGDFNMAGDGVPANRIARWNGSTWAPLGDGMNTGPWALTVFNDGTGAALYAAGPFSAPADRVAKWNGVAWSPVGAAGWNALIATLAVFDEGGGPKLYAGGLFTVAGGVPANHVARWNGTAWAPLGNGTNDYVYALFPFNDGSGSALWAGGEFSVAGSAGTNFVAKWAQGTPPPPPTLTASPSTVQTGASVTVTLTGGSGGTNDWLDFVPTTAADTTYLPYWSYVGAGVTTRAWSVTPGTPGTYEFRYFLNNGFTRAATSPPVTVTQ